MKVAQRSCVRTTSARLCAIQSTHTYPHPRAPTTVSVFAFLYLPKSASEAWFLTENERRIAYQRIQIDSSSRVNEKFILKDALGVRDTTNIGVYKKFV